MTEGPDHCPQKLPKALSAFSDDETMSFADGQNSEALHLSFNVVLGYLRQVHDAEIHALREQLRSQVLDCPLEYEQDVPVVPEGKPVHSETVDTKRFAMTKTWPSKLLDNADSNASLQMATGTLDARVASIVARVRYPRKTTQTLHNVFANIMRHPFFDMLCTFGIFANAFFLGMQVDRIVEAQTDGLPTTYEIINVAFSLWFLSELIIRFMAQGVCEFFYFSHDRVWNVYDMLVVGADIIETFLKFLIWRDRGDGGTRTMSVMRCLRVLRLARAARVLRIVYFLKELRLMVLSILHCGRTMLWAALLLSLTIYMFALFLMQNVKYYKDNKVLEDEVTRELTYRFSSVVFSCYTLFLAVTGGINWNVFCDPLIEIDWTNGVVICFYIFFTMFALLNIVTGIFVEAATTSVQNDNDEVVLEEMSKDDSNLKQLLTIFHDADKDRSGYITLAEFKTLLHDNRTVALLRRIGLETTQAVGIFRLLDSDRSGSLSCEEFLLGCMRIRGGAKAVDLATLMTEHNRITEIMRCFFSHAETEFLKLKEAEMRIEAKLDNMANANPTFSAERVLEAITPRGVKLRDAKNIRSVLM